MDFSGGSASLSRWRLLDKGQQVQRRCAEEVSMSTFLETGGFHGTTRRRLLCDEVGSQNSRGKRLKPLMVEAGKGQTCTCQAY